MIAFILKHKFFLILLVINLLVFGLIVLPQILKLRPLPIDAYRDIAYARNVLNGRSIFEDPAVKDEFIWYPPLNPLLMAILSRITTIDVFYLYIYSPLYILFFIPLLFYLLLSHIFHKETRRNSIAFCSVLTIPIMPWLSTHMFSYAMPSIHAFVVILLILIYFVKACKTGLGLKKVCLPVFF